MGINLEKACIQSSARVNMPISIQMNAGGSLTDTTLVTFV